MIILIIGISLGLAALMLRSIAVLVGVGFAMVAVYAAAAILTLSSVHLVSLLMAIAGYNLGISAGLIGMMTFHRITAQWRSLTSEGTNS